MCSLIRIAFRHRNLINFTECRRFAGHSKWANIRHTKMEKDSEKATALQSLIKKMKVAIAEGKSAKPDENVRLARLIEQAKKSSMPMASIKNLLEKMQKSKIGGQTAVFETRGPSGCVVLIQILSENVIHSRNYVNSHLKKSQFTPADTPSKGMYEEKGIILTEIDNRDEDKITEDAIEVGAEEAEKLKEEDKEFIQFTCSPSQLTIVKSKLEELKYKIIQADVEYIPQVCVTLKEEEMELVSKLFERLSSVEEVVKVYSNIS